MRCVLPGVMLSSCWLASVPQFGYVSRYLVTSGNKCKHLYHTLAALKRYFSASLVAPLPNSEQINHPFSNHTYTKSMPNHNDHHYSPFVTLTYTTHIIFSTAPTYAPHCHPWISGQPHWSDCTTGQMNGKAG